MIRNSTIKRTTPLKRSTKPLPKTRLRPRTKPTNVLKPPKAVTVTRAKEDAWKAFSRYIRLRDSLRYNHSTEFGPCYTCKKIYPNWRVGGLQAGHFIPGRRNAYLFDERGVHSQCNVCNKHLKGNWPNYMFYMECEYGPQVVKELRELYTSGQALQRKVYEYQALEMQYKALYDALIKKHESV